MADSKANGLVKRVFVSLPDITGVRIWSQKDGEDDALGLEMSEMVSSEIVAEGSELDYQSLTPKGFAASIANTGRKGIVEFATNAEVISGESDKVVSALQLKNAADDAAEALEAKIIKGSYSIGDLNTGKFNYTITHNGGSTAYSAMLTLYTLNNSSTSVDYGLRAPRLVSKSANSMVVSIQKLNDANIDLRIDWAIVY